MALIAAVAGAFFFPAMAHAKQPPWANYYEAEQSPYYLGTGGATAGDPVDVGSGGHQVTETLGVLPGRVPFTLSWGFVARDGSEGPLGLGTWLSCDYFISPSSIYGPGYYELVTPGNKHFLFQGNGTNLFTNHTDPEVMGATLSILAVDESSMRREWFRLRWKDGTQFLFNPRGALVRIEDVYRNAVVIERNSHDLAMRIVESGGREILLEYTTNNLLNRVVLPLNRVWQFAYSYNAFSNSSCVTSVTDPLGGVTQYVWDGFLRPAEYPRVPPAGSGGGTPPDPTQPGGNPPLITDPGFPGAPPAWVPPAIVNPPTGGGSGGSGGGNDPGGPVITPPPPPPVWGYPWPWLYHYPYSWWRWWPFIPHYYAFGPNGEVLEYRVTDPSAESLGYPFESNGLQLPLPSPIAEGPAFPIDPAYPYVPSGPYVALPIPLDPGNGGIHSASVPVAPRPTSGILDSPPPLPPPSPLPLIVKIIDRAGRNRLHCFYDNKGRMIKQVTADGGETHFEYSANQTRVTYPSGDSETFHYQWNPVAYGYNVVSHTNALNQTVTYERTGTTNLLTAIVDERGRRTEFEWDEARGNLLHVTAPRPSGGTMIASTTYDAVWNSPTAAVGFDGNTSSVTLDPATGAVLQSQNARGVVTQYGYGPQGDLLQVNQGRRRSVFTYTGRGELLTAVSPEGRLAEYGYDDASRLVRAYPPRPSEQGRAANSAEGTQWVYNAMDQVTYQGSSLDLVTYPENPQFAMRFDYDIEGNLTRLALPADVRYEWKYDAMDRPIQARDPYGKLTKATYTNGRLATMTDRLGNQWTYSYLPGGLPYSVAMNGYEDIPGSANARQAVSQTVYYQYDGLYRLANVSDGGTGTQFSYTYDTFDRMIQENGPQGVTHYAYNDFDQVTQSVLPSGDILRYTYNALGDLYSVTTPVDPQYMDPAASITFQYDALGRVSQQISGRRLGPGANQWESQTTTMAYTPDGLIASQLQSLSSPNVFGGRTEGHAFTYDIAGRLERDSLNNGGPELGYKRYGYDGNGRLRVAELNPDGQSTQVYSYAYDTLGNLLHQSGPGYTTRYAYDSKWQRMIHTWRATNDTNEMIPLSEQWLNYNDRGDTINWNGSRLAWDAQGRLLGMDGNGVTARYDYDAFGRRLSRNLNGIDKASAVWSGWGQAYPFVRSDNQSNLVSTWADGIGSVSSSSPGYIGAPGTGQTTSATRFDYLPYGALRSATAINANGTANPNEQPDYRGMGWAGMEADLDMGASGWTASGVNTGLYYASHRYYAPTLGRFISEDPAGLAGGLHPYAYCDGDPVNFADPFGLARINLFGTDFDFDANVWASGLDTGLHGAMSGATFGLYDGGAYRCQVGFGGSQILGGIGSAAALLAGQGALLADHRDGSQQRPLPSKQCRVWSVGARSRRGKRIYSPTVGG